MRGWLNRAILGFLLLLLGGWFLFFTDYWLETRREASVVEARHAELRARLDDLQADRLEKEAYLRRFLDDRDFVERVVRERLGYVRPGEVIFQFEDSVD